MQPYPHDNHHFLGKAVYDAVIPSFFFNDTATTEIYTLSLHDALPILMGGRQKHNDANVAASLMRIKSRADRKSTRLNSSHSSISYAVFCLKKKKTQSSFLT